MAPTILQVVQGIETQLATIDGLRVTEYVPDQINPPQASVGPPAIPEYRSSFRRGIFAITPTVTIFTSAATDRAGQWALMDYMNPTGSKSIPAAIEADKTLGGLVDDCIVDNFTPLGLEQVGALGYYGGVFSLRVICPGM